MFLLSVCNQGKNIIVFYGSQTGTAEEFANRLSKDAQRYGMKGMTADPEEYDMVICMWNNIQITKLKLNKRSFSFCWILLIISASGGHNDL